MSVSRLTVRATVEAEGVERALVIAELAARVLEVKLEMANQPNHPKHGTVTCSSRDPWPGTVGL